ncbi:nucleotidyltransferase domain-containing protein [Carnobacterium gallinarum]|uniref:nucleotidyltransferase domain-containing protein n=1 Tax=Carnobacterium gallinarum TaxID=2749 RepID=UPI0005506FAC|nr:nucleotidyltransferase domain-containing protein [Carnobacterium gallinarum]
MREIIKQALLKIEKEHQVRVLYAVESGSRAWGFPSKDSDYDVRFIYVHTEDWYLSLAPKRDVIECPIDDELDVCGWDLQKTLTLLRKSNPSLIEWLKSPIVYQEVGGLAEELRQLAEKHLSKKHLMYHYYHMANGNFRDYLQGKQVKIKKYFYVLRPILACLWIEVYQTAPPVRFEDLLVLPQLQSDFLAEVADLLVRKKRGDELDLEARSPVLHEFIKSQLARLEEQLKVEAEKQSPLSYGQLDQVFRKYL